MTALENIAELKSLRIPMRDGVKVAVDLWLPKVRRETVPTIILQTRYLRAIQWRWLAHRLGLPELLDVHGSTRERFLRAGYAWVDVDVRGTGASEGRQLHPWSRDEVLDAAQVVDWVVSQPWSNGRVGATGVSYAGTAAEMLASNRHPALKAIAPRFSLFDVYPDVVFPGGVHLAWFTEEWSKFNDLLDANCYANAVGAMTRVNQSALATWARHQNRPFLAAALKVLATMGSEHLVRTGVGLLARGVRPCDGQDQTYLNQLASARANTDVHAAALGMVHRDDTGLVEDHPDIGADNFSPHTRVDALRESGVAVLSVSGWLDGAYQHSAIKRHHALGGNRRWLLLGPWEHGGRQNISPHSAARKSQFDHDEELLRFFDAHLRDAHLHDDGEFDAPRVRYFTVGEERWKSAEQWPPKSVETSTLFVQADGALNADAPETGGEYRREIRDDVGTGVRSRWRSLLGLAAPVGYDVRGEKTRHLLRWDGPALDRPLEVTGHPVVRLWVEADEVDLAIFVYLDDVAPDGDATYITEGQLRARHRKVAGWSESGAPKRTFESSDAKLLVPGEPTELIIDLLPVSYRLAPGHRLRLSVAGADCDHFRTDDIPARRFSVLYGPSYATRIELPVSVLHHLDDPPPLSPGV